LGLAISKRLATLLNGTLEVTSKVGEGSEFVLTVPITFGELRKQDTAKEKPQQDDFSEKHVLLVEDVEINRFIVDAILEPTGCVIDEASDGEQAVQMAKQNRYDIILMDVQMPIMDGLTATKLIREFDSAVPIIAMTANAFAEDAQMCIEAGMNAHLPKPIESSVFFEILHRYFEETPQASQDS
jgi:CheY-like chemotaxis protein